jgi:hypothetical protein
LQVNPPRIRRTETPVRRRDSYPPKIGHSCLGGHFSENRVAIETEIGPESCAEKHYVPDLNPAILQNMHVRALSNLFDFRSELRDLLSIEFVISQNVDYWPIWKCLENPFDPILASVNVTGEHNDVSIRVARLERSKLKMEIAQDLNVHD